MTTVRLRRILGLVALLAWAGHVKAQPGGMDGKRAPLQPGWVDQIGRGPGVLVGWEVRGGQIMDPDGIIHLGGPSPTIARLTTPLSEEFKLFMEYQTPDPQSIRVRFYRHTTMFSGGFMERRLAPGSAGAWVELTLSGAPRPGGGYEVVQDERHRNGSSRSSSSQGDAVAWIELEVPAGQSLAIRRLELLSTAPAASAQSLVPAVAVLVVFLLGVMGLGWFVNRRRRAAA